MRPEDFIKIVKEKHERMLGLQKSDISVDLALDYRKKGLLWFSTYTVDYKSQYGIKNPVALPVRVVMAFPFPSSSAVYDNMAIEAPGIADLAYDTGVDERGQSRMVARFTLPANASQLINFRYKSRGMNEWTYQFGKNMEIVKDFKLTMRTDFDNIDFPRESISPDRKEHETSGGWTLTWEKESLVSAVQIGMVMPTRINPGPLAAAMCTTAPVSLLFFFFMIFTLQVMRGIKLHPMNYFFLAASFFAFNILFSYLVDHLDVKLSFIISAAVSYFLVVSYLRLVVSSRFALVEAGMSQFIYQILFAFAHFFEGYTGLAVTIGAIISLAVLMRMTAKIDWDESFKDKDWGGMPGRKKGGPRMGGTIEGKARPQAQSPIVPPPMGEV